MRPFFVAWYLLVVEVVLAVNQVIESCVLAVEGEPDRADGAVTLLADDDFGYVRVLGLWVVHHIAVDEEDNVGILLDSTGLTQVGVDRSLVWPLLQCPVQL